MHNNKYKIFRSGLMLLVLLSVLSCKKETEMLDESTFGYDFFPVATGKSWTYASDSIIYDNGGAKRDTFRSFIREEIGEKFLDEEGHPVFKVYRFFRRNQNDAWTRINTWTTEVDSARAIRTEENLKFVKLVFPVKKGLRWDGNVFIDEDLRIEVAGESIEPYKNWKHRMEETDEVYTYKGAGIPSIRVNLVDDSSIIDRRKVTEYYGKGLGLVRKEMMILDSDGSKPGDPWEQKAQKGFIHTLTLIDHN